MQVQADRQHKRQKQKAAEGQLQMKWQILHGHKGSTFYAGIIIPF
jgi:hypothetical protein